MMIYLKGIALMYFLFTLPAIAGTVAVTGNIDKITSWRFTTVGTVFTLDAPPINPANCPQNIGYSIRPSDNPTIIDILLEAKRNNQAVTLLISDRQCNGSGAATHQRGSPVPEGSALFPKINAVAID